MKDKTKTIPLKIAVDLRKLTKEEGWPKIAAYVFSTSGRFISKQLLKPDPKSSSTAVGELKVKTKLDNLIVKIGPDMEDSIMLDKYQPFTEKISLKDKVEMVVDIDKIYWICWLKYAYQVKGTVSKTGNLPICAGEVDIYDVDIRHCILKLPDFVIEKIRKGFIDIVVDPPPFDPEIIDFERPEVWWGNDDDDDWCGTGPKGPFPPKIDIIRKLDALPTHLSFSRDRYLNLDNAVERVNSTLSTMSLTSRRSFLDTELVEGVKLSQILYTNTTQFRTLLLDHFIVIRYWLCWWPWIYWLWWPYCGYSLEYLGSTVLKADGSFEKTVWLSVCRKDTPDLWFKVRQNINGIDRVIYARYPVPCNTYWNHPSGQPVHLLVTDPNAVACHQGNPGTGTAYVLPMGIYEDEWYQVENAHIKAHCNPAIALPSNCGLYNQTDPYGTRLDFRMEFHDDIYNNNIRYYRWSYRKHGNISWINIDTPITHRHIKMVSPGKYTIDAVNLGPKTKGGTNDLFEVPDPNLSWLSNRNDLAYAIWNTATWNGNVYIPQVSDGKYDLRLEMFDQEGNKVQPSTSGFKFMLPTAVFGVLDDSLFVEADGSLIIHLHVNNKDTVADIKAIKLNGSAIGDCQFLEYCNKTTDDVTIKYDAYHPTTAYNFLSHYNLYIKRGIFGTVVQSLTNQPTSVMNKEQTYKVKDILGTYEQCAFTASLHTYPRTRDGHSRIRAYEAYDSSAFALTKKAVCP
jgi:hypothetical protein